MNFYFFGGLFRLRYAYVDLYTGSNYIADSLFFRHKVPVRYGKEAVKEDEKYRIVFCKIRRKYRQEFEKALAEISDKMSLLGYNDYDQFCCELKNWMEEDQAAGEAETKE